MPVQIGAKSHSFSEPTGLLSDCHRRIEMFLASLGRVAALSDKPLPNDARAALEAALRYFRDAAPKHTEDEEQSLFPRLRKLQDPSVKTALETLQLLERDHRQADLLHAEADALGRKCLAEGRLSETDADQFRRTISQLASVYKDHIHIEDELVFPVAGRVLSETDKAAIATEMAARRK